MADAVKRPITEGLWAGYRGHIIADSPVNVIKIEANGAVWVETIRGALVKLRDCSDLNQGPLS